jgi:cytochrome c-type biogenesis protein CcmH/NrfF
MPPVPVRGFLAAFCFAALLPGCLFAGASDSTQQRIAALEGKLLAPCCYQEPVKIHQSEAAVRMRMEIARWVEEGRSDTEILDAYVGQYGSKVLTNFAPTPPWAVLVPWLLVLLGSVVLGWWIRRLVRVHALQNS